VYDSAVAGRLPPWPPGAQRPSGCRPRRLRTRRLDRVTDAIPAPIEAVCSARGCRAPARWALKWNNPRLHDPDRRKTWLACADHRKSLGDFLDARRFLRDVSPLDTSPTLEP
jgi:hypothetical protein